MWAWRPLFRVRVVFFATFPERSRSRPRQLTIGPFRKELKNVTNDSLQQSAPPTQLPQEFDGIVEVFEIVNSEFPGYVYLVWSYLLGECTCTDYEKYKCVEYQKEFSSFKRSSEFHGPAQVTRWSQTMLPPIMGRVAGSSYSHDDVYCIRCLTWPPQAADWPTRQRNCDWPDSATLDRVVSNGCDVVGVAHRQCRRDESMSQHQCRLSFSRAEIVLLNSWTKIQQIVYHMLRIFVKTERLTDSAENSDAATLSSYHIKTLMLWACELKPKSWWIDDLNLVRLSVELLHKLFG